MRTPWNIKLLVASLLFVTVSLNSIINQGITRVKTGPTMCISLTLLAWNESYPFSRELLLTTDLPNLALLVANSSEINSQSTH